MSVPNRLPSYPGGPPASGGQDPHAARPTAALPQGYPTNPGMPPTGHPTGHGYPQQAYGQQQAYPQQGYPTNPGAQLESGVVPTPQGYQALAAPHVTAPPPHAGAASAPPGSAPYELHSAPIHLASGPVSASGDPLVGALIDNRYQVEKRLGEGGMGVVYLARHRVIDRRVALKVLRAEFAKDREILERFLQEAKTASSIGNPHIVDIHDFGVLPDGSTYFAMEYLEGEPLMALVVREKIPVDRILRIGLQICDGLSAAHERGIVHRDLKPDNIYVARRASGDFVKVLDFGIAKVEHAAGPKLTRAGAVFGTPHYMSPEQAAGTPVDHRADIYALGVILYEMATGQLPFDSENPMSILTQHMYKAPVPIRTLVNGADRPPGLEAIVQKCLLKRPDNRYQSMTDLAADLARLEKGEAPLAIADLMARSSSAGIPADYFKAGGKAAGEGAPPAKNRRLGLAVAGGLAVALLGIGAFVLLGKKAPATAPRLEEAAAAAEPPVEPAKAPALAQTAAPAVTETAAPTQTASAAPIVAAPPVVTAPSPPARTVATPPKPGATPPTKTAAPAKTTAPAPSNAPIQIF